MSKARSLVATFSLTLGLSGLVTCAGGEAASAAPEGPGNLLSVGYASGPFSESLLDEGLSASADPSTRYQLRLGLAWSPWDRFWLHVSRGSYQIEDQDFPGVSHRRTDTKLLLGTAWVLPLLGGQADVGIGYAAQGLETDSTARTPGNEPALLFTPWQLVHGPAVVQSYRRPLWGPFSIAWDAEVIPYGFASLSDPRIALPSVTTLWVAPRLCFWDERVSVGYFYERSIGSGFNRELRGWLASVSIAGI